MVWIQLRDGKYDVLYEYLEGSKVIQDALNHNKHGKPISEQNPVYISVNTHDWNLYIKFLQTGIPNNKALKVIDFLDNYDQAKQWLIAAYTNRDTT